MKKFRLHLILSALLIYLIIRLVNDSFSGNNHILTSSATLILIEISACILVVYLIDFYTRKYLSYINLKNNPVTRKQVLKDLFIYVLGTMVIVNLIITPMVAFTDDGISMSDVVLISVITIFLAIVHFLYGSLAAYLRKHSLAQVRLERMEVEKATAELRFLKNQINPHFIFNALNTVYFLIKSNPDDARKSVENISGMLRYSLYDGERDLVPLNKEWKYVEQYIYIQSKRYGEKLSMDIEINGNQDVLVHPHIIIPFVENAIKHNDLASAAPFLHVKVDVTENNLHLLVRNSCKVEGRKEKTIGGLGLQNVAKRLSIIYPEKHSLNYGQVENIYTIELSITL